MKGKGAQLKEEKKRKTTAFSYLINRSVKYSDLMSGTQHCWAYKKSQALGNDGAKFHEMKITNSCRNPRPHLHLSSMLQLTECKILIAVLETATNNDLFLPTFLRLQREMKDGKVGTVLMFIWNEGKSYQ